MELTLPLLICDEHPHRFCAAALVLAPLFYVLFTEEDFIVFAVVLLISVSENMMDLEEKSRNINPEGWIDCFV
ncbi:MAG: hypothetical protein LBD66_02230 [Holosporales bacterium]|nr:hypothetical protein [Holosporales bacterium]